MDPNPSTGIIEWYSVQLEASLKDPWLRVNALLPTHVDFKISRFHLYIVRQLEFGLSSLFLGKDLRGVDVLIEIREKIKRRGNDMFQSNHPSHVFLNAKKVLSYGGMRMYSCVQRRNC